MAEENSGIKRQLEDLEKEMLCGICKSQCKDLRVLTCCHYYCKQCINKSTTKDSNSFTCPNCNFNTFIPDGGSETFSGVCFVNGVEEKCHLLKIALGSVETKCEACSDTSSFKAKAFCTDCSGFICDGCTTSHQKLKIYKPHSIILLDSLNDSKAREIISVTSTNTCSEHTSTTSLYCFDCHCFICNICKTDHHKGHKTELTMNVTSTAKTEMSRASDSLEDASIKASDILKKIKATKQSSNDQGDSIAAAINKSCDELHKIVDIHKKNVLEDTRILVKENIDELTKQEVKIQTAIGSMHNSLNYTAKCLAYSTDHDLILNQAEIQHRLEHEVDLLEQEINVSSDENGGPTGLEAHILRCDELDTFLKNKMWITRPTLVTGRRDKLQNNEVMEITLSGKCTIDLNFKGLGDSPAAEGKLTTKEHRIDYTPSYRGLHELTISVNGKEINSSPVSILASIPPEEQSKPCKVLSGFERPISVAVNSKGDIIVPQLQAGAIILDRNGATRKTIDRSKLTQLLSSVAVDANDSIYFSSQCTNEITKFDSDGSIHQSFKVNQHCGPGHYSIAVINDEVMLTERENEGVVMVYSQDMKFKREINGTTSRYFDISSDNYGNIYVTDRKNARMHIQVFSNSGLLLSTFENSISCSDEPTYPCSIFVSGRYMYITNRNSASVYTTENEYIKSFVVKGSEMTWPCGVSVCVDKHGFVYVCDCSSSQIAVY